MNVWPAYAHLAGREQELRVLARMLDRSTDRARLVAVVGERGVGKSALLAELTGAARRRGFEVCAGLPPRPVRAGADRSPTGRLAPWIEALDEYVAQIGPARLRALPGVDHDVLAATLPSLGGPRVGLGESGLDRLHMFRAVRLLLRATPAPGLLVVLDDLEQADDESVELLDYLMRRDLAAPVIFAVGYRDGRRSARLEALVTGAAVANRAERIKLGPLSAEETESLIDESVSRSRRRFLVRASGGNPLCLEVLLRSGVDGHQHTYALVADPAVEATFAPELATLSPMARAVTRAAAVVGERFTPDVVANVAELDEQTALAALDELTYLDIVRPTEEPRVFAFWHDLVRRAAYQDAPPGQRLSAHARAAVALASRGAQPMELAPHVEQSTRRGDMGAVRLLANAAAALRPRHPELEVRWLRTALRVLPADGAGGYRLALQVNLASACARAGALSESRRVLHEVLLLLPRGSGRARARSVSFCGEVEWSLGRPERAVALLREELHATTDEWAAAALALRLAACELLTGVPSASRDWAALALRRAGQAEDRALEAGALAVLAAAESMGGRPADAARWLDRAVPMLDAMLDSNLTELPEALVWAGLAELGIDRLDASLRHLDRAVSLLCETGEDLALPRVLVIRTIVLRRLGWLAEAMRCCDDLAEVATSRSSKEFLAIAEVASHWIGVCRGRLPATSGLEAAALAADALAASPIAGWYETQANLMLAEIRLAVGDPAGCLAMVDTFGGRTLRRADPRSRVLACGLFSAAEAELGRPDRAGLWAREARKLADRHRLPGARGVALLAMSATQLDADPEAAAGLAGRAGEAFATAGMRLEAAIARLRRGAALVAAGDGREAAVALAAAHAELKACGAQSLAREAIKQRRRLAGQARRVSGQPAQDDVGRLTGREREVALLVTQGLTNRQIAQRLHVTEKTVEMHLSRVFTKLGVHSRAAVAGTVAHSQGAAESV